LFIKFLAFYGSSWARNLETPREIELAKDAWDSIMGGILSEHSTETLHKCIQLICMGKSKFIDFPPSPVQFAGYVHENACLVNQKKYNQDSLTEKWCAPTQKTLSDIEHSMKKASPSVKKALEKIYGRLKQEHQHNKRFYEINPVPS
jgi:hypothetical protein